jgi:hypothetical protein
LRRGELVEQRADLWKSIAWLAGTFLVFVPLAVRAYKRAS